MTSYQDLLFQNRQQPIDNADDLLISSLTNESHVMFKSGESMKSVNKKKSINPRQLLLQSQQFEQNLQEETTSKKTYQCQDQELQLVNVVQSLKHQLKQQQQEFYCKELEFQQKLLQMQKDQDAMMQLTKTKYEMIIDDLQQQLNSKNQEIIHITSLFQQISQEVVNQVRPTARKLQMTEENCHNTGYYTSRQQEKPNYASNHCSNSSNRTNHSGLQDEKLLSLYRQEIDKLKKQTLEFEMKFENEKKSIKQEINMLKSQKLVLQNLICQKSNPVSDKQSFVGSEHKTARSKRESQSMQGKRFKKSFEF